MALCARTLFLVAAVCAASPAPAAQADPEGTPGQSADEPAERPVFPRSWLVVQGVDERGRRPFRPDHVFERHLLEPDAEPPSAGQSLEGELGQKRIWDLVETTEGRVGSADYAYTTVLAERDHVVLAVLSGASTLFVNGHGFVGDVYQYGFGGVPVALRRGANHVFVTGIRGSFQLALEEPPDRLFVADWDPTLPDAIRGERLPAEAAVLVVNAGRRVARGVGAALGLPGEELARATGRGVLVDLPPLSVTKLPATLVVPPAYRAAGESVTLEAAVLDEEGRTAALTAVRDSLRRTPFEVGVLPAGATHRRTFRSALDDSVQEWALVVPDDRRPPEDGRGLVLSLHGAGVQCINQARCYSRKADFWVAAPTNRRAFGFDWQDWGRLDAYEVLERALEVSGVAADRVYLTGHSMGGHGTWHLGANDPDRFAAIAPSAGWESFDSYGGRPAGPLAELWHRADGASSTLHLIPNLAQLPTYVLHGAEDNNVPLSQAETMLDALRRFGAEPVHHFQERAGHWWGNQCVDWPPISDFFREHRRPQAPERIDFLTVDPGIDAEHYWATAWQPREYGRPMRIAASYDRQAERVTVDTENAGVFRVKPPPEWRVRQFEVDGRKFDSLGVLDTGWFRFEGSGWRRGQRPTGQKSPASCGPFKRAFDHGFVLVHGTAGRRVETAELFARARYDAQVWWYRGNGRARIVADRAFDPAAHRGRNVILYGNRDTNTAWSALLPDDCPLDARRGKLTCGDSVYEGDALAAVFVRPRADDEERLVGVFADTGWRGSRLGYGLAPFVSGVGYPDYAVFGREVLTGGDLGVVDGGWFDARWAIPE